MVRKIPEQSMCSEQAQSLRYLSYVCCEYECVIIINNKYDSNQGRPIEKEQWLAFAKATIAMSNDIARYQFQWPDEDDSRDVVTDNTNVQETTLEKTDDQPRIDSPDDAVPNFSNGTAQTTIVTTEMDP